MRFPPVRIAKFSVPLLALFFAHGCSLFGGTDPNSPVACVSRNGSCFEMTVNGVKVVPLSSESKTLLANYKPNFAVSQQADIHYTAWETAEPITGKLKLDATNNYRGSVWFGGHAGLSEPIVFSLDGAKLKFTQSIGSSAPGDPRGAAILQKRLAQDTLPAGNYIFVVSYVGQKNWDQKYVLVHAR